MSINCLNVIFLFPHDIAFFRFGKDDIQQEICGRPQHLFYFSVDAIWLPCSCVCTVSTNINPTKYQIFGTQHLIERLLTISLGI